MPSGDCPACGLPSQIIKAHRRFIRDLEVAREKTQAHKLAARESKAQHRQASRLVGKLENRVAQLEAKVAGLEDRCGDLTRAVSHTKREKRLQQLEFDNLTSETNRLRVERAQINRALRQVKVLIP
jgi:chromosome segregation ATPase